MKKKYDNTKMSEQITIDDGSSCYFCIHGLKYYHWNCITE